MDSRRYDLLWFLLGALALGFFLSYSVYGTFMDSAVVDEAPHLAAGLTYVQDLDYRFNPEHPPLAKLIPGLFAQVLVAPELPRDATWWQDGINEQWRAGATLLAGYAGVDPLRLTAAARAGSVAIALSFLFTLWLFSVRRYGTAWGTLILIPSATAPLILGHGHLINTDVAATFGALIGIASFGAWLSNQTRLRFILAGVCFGVASLAKFSLLLLIPTYLLVALVILWKPSGSWRRANFYKPALRIVARVAGVVLIGYAFVVYPTYAVLTTGYPAAKQREDAAFLLSSFAGGPVQPGTICNPLRCLAELTVAASDVPVLRPLAQYGLGVLMVMQRSRGGSTVYFAGEVGSAGDARYFPTVLFTKETLPMLLIMLGGFGYVATRAYARYRRDTRLLATRIVALARAHATEATMIVFTLIYLAMSIRSSLNIGLRHLMPILPLLYLLAMLAWRRIVAADARRTAILAGLLVLHILSVAAAMPHMLSYYNALAGGTERGYRVATDSNYDWGQDLGRLRIWLDEHPEVDRLAIDYYSGSMPKPYLGDRGVAWEPSMGNPHAYGIQWLAVSINNLLLATQRPVRLEPRLFVDEYRWLAPATGQVAVPPNLPEPYARIGTSFFVYKLTN